MLTFLNVSQVTTKQAIGKLKIMMRVNAMHCKTAYICNNSELHAFRTFKVRECFETVGNRVVLWYVSAQIVVEKLFIKK